jgi:hypothetical protein
LNDRFELIEPAVRRQSAYRFIAIIEDGRLSIYWRIQPIGKRRGNLVFQRIRQTHHLKLVGFLSLEDRPERTVEVSRRTRPMSVCNIDSESFAFPTLWHAAPRS